MIASRKVVVSRNTSGMGDQLGWQAELRFQVAKQISEAMRDVPQECHIRQISCVFDGDLAGQIHVYYEAA